MTFCCANPPLEHGRNNPISPTRPTPPTLIVHDHITNRKDGMRAEKSYTPTSNSAASPTMMAAAADNCSVALSCPQNPRISPLREPLLSAFREGFPVTPCKHVWCREGMDAPCGNASPDRIRRPTSPLPPLTPPLRTRLGRKTYCPSSRISAHDLCALQLWRSWHHRTFRRASSASTSRRCCAIRPWV